MGDGLRERSRVRLTTHTSRRVLAFEHSADASSALNTAPVGNQSRCLMSQQRFKTGATDPSSKLAELLASNPPLHTSSSTLKNRFVLSVTAPRNLGVYDGKKSANIA